MPVLRRLGDGGVIMQDIFGQPYETVQPVNHPAYYQTGGIEAIDVIEAWGLGFCLGNTVKYIARAGKKGNRLTDLKKAAWYLSREIEKEECK